MKKRLFYSISLSDEAKIKIRNIIDDLSVFREQVKWENTGKIHITLLFLGDTERKEQLVLENDTNDSAKFPIFEYKIGSLGFFPNLKMPRIIWLGTTGAELMKEISVKLREICKSNSIKIDEKDFKPHITIGRVKGTLSDEFKKYLLNYKYEQIKEKVTNFELMSSILDSKGSVYKTESKFNLMEK